MEELTEPIVLKYDCCNLHDDYSCHTEPPFKLVKDGGDCADQEELDEAIEDWKNKDTRRLKSMEDSRMVSVFKFIPDREEQEQKYWIIEVRTDRIGVFDSNGKLEHVVSGINIKSCHF